MPSPRPGRAGGEGGLEVAAESGAHKLEPPVRIEAVQTRGVVVRQPGLEQDQEVPQSVAPEELVAGQPLAACVAAGADDEGGDVAE